MSSLGRLRRRCHVLQQRVRRDPFRRRPPFVDAAANNCPPPHVGAAALSKVADRIPARQVEARLAHASGGRHLTRRRKSVSHWGPPLPSPRVRCAERREKRTKEAASMIPSSTGCEQSMVNLSVCLRLVIFFALATCEQSGIVDTVIETASDAKGGRRHGEERRTAAGMVPCGHAT